jgi:hypothetical protein
MDVIGEEKSERLEVIPAQHCILITRRPKSCGRCAGSDFRTPGSALGCVIRFSAAARSCALAISRSLSFSCNWSGSSRSECRPNCVRWNCRMIKYIRSQFVALTKQRQRHGR